jgi:CRISPR-associated endoribonuclease Cas6
MLSHLDISIKPADNKDRISPFLGSLLHGVIMQTIDPDYADVLHQNELKPYSQYVFYDKEQSGYVWRISSLNEQSREYILEKLVEKLGDSVFISNRNMTLSISSKKLSDPVTYKELTEKFFLKEDASRRTTIHFLANSTFKTNGEYQIFPEIANVYSSLYKKWNSFFSLVSLESAEVLEHLITHTKLIGYELRSSKYEMEKVRINCFRGDICLHVSGPATLASIAKILFAFGEYSGIGAKCALGMGGIKID